MAGRTVITPPDTRRVDGRLVTAIEHFQTPLESLQIRRGDPVCQDKNMRIVWLVFLGRQPDGLLRTLTLLSRAMGEE